MVTGQLVVLDRNMNMCLNNAYEKLPSTGSSKCTNETCGICDVETIFWGKVWINGEDILDIYDTETAY